MGVERAGSDVGDAVEEVEDWIVQLGGVPKDADL